MYAISLALLIAIVNSGLSSWWLLPNALQQYGITGMLVLGCGYLVVLGGMLVFEGKQAEVLQRGIAQYPIFTGLLDSSIIVATLLLLALKLNFIIWCLQSFTLVLIDDSLLPTLTAVRERFNEANADQLLQIGISTVVVSSMVLCAIVIRRLSMIIVLPWAFVVAFLALAIAVFLQNAYGQIQLLSQIHIPLQQWPMMLLHLATIISSTTMLGVGMPWVLRNVWGQAAPVLLSCCLTFVLQFCIGILVVLLIANAVEQQVYSLPTLLFDIPFSIRNASFPKYTYWVFMCVLALCIYLQISVLIQRLFMALDDQFHAESQLLILAFIWLMLVIITSGDNMLAYFIGADFEREFFEWFSLLHITAIGATLLHVLFTAALLRRVAPLPNMWGNYHRHLGLLLFFITGGIVISQAVMQW